MTIIIKKEPDLHLTQNEYNRLLAEYNQTFSFYAGVPPTFESWAHQKQKDAGHESGIGWNLPPAT